MDNPDNTTDITQSQINTSASNLNAGNVITQIHNGGDSPLLNPATSLTGFTVTQVPDASVAPTNQSSNGMFIYQVDNLNGVAHYWLWSYLVYADQSNNAYTGTGNQISAWEGVQIDSLPTPPSTNIQTFNASSTWNMPVGAKAVTVICVGGGGGGQGGNALFDSGTPAGIASGFGAGGGAVTITTFNAALLPSSVSLTVGTGGPGGNGAVGVTLNTVVNGSAGTAGGTTSFGTFAQAGGGDGASYLSSGPGGGALSNHIPISATTTNAIGGQGAVGTGGASDGYNAEWGGGSGASSTSTGGGQNGGSSIWGAGGGGSGQGGDGGNGGTNGSYSAGGGGLAGNPGGNGAPNTTSQAGYGGAGGGGGNNARSGVTTATGANGGNGGAPGGGGGGGGYGLTISNTRDAATGGNGGSGAAGQIVVITYF